MSVDTEQLAQEAALFPWLDSDCMADPTCEDWFADDDYYPDMEEDDEQSV
jgi:hypothetical protein